MSPVTDSRLMGRLLVSLPAPRFHAGVGGIEEVGERRRLSARAYREELALALAQASSAQNDTTIHPSHQNAKGAQQRALWCPVVLIDCPSKRVQFTTQAHIKVPGKSRSYRTHLRKWPFERRRVQGLGSGFSLQGSGLRVQGQGSAFRVQGLERTKKLRSPDFH